MVIQRMIVLNHRHQIHHSRQDGQLLLNLGRPAGNLALYAIVTAMGHPHSLVRMLDLERTCVAIMIQVRTIL